MRQLFQQLRIYLKGGKPAWPWNASQPLLAKNVTFQRNDGFARFIRYYSWHYFWGGRRYGLLFNDQVFEPDPKVQEALRRLNLKEPWLFDERKVRLIKAHNMAMHKDRLPKDEWTKWEEETFYLKPYLDEIEMEIKLHEDSTGLLPKFFWKTME